MWTVVYVSKSYEISKKLTELLSENRIISFLRKIGDDDEYEVLVPDTELEEAQDIIFENELF